MSRSSGWDIYRDEERQSLLMLLPLLFCLLFSGAVELDVEMLGEVISLVKTNISLSMEDVFKMLGKKKVLTLGFLLG